MTASVLNFRSWARRSDDWSTQETAEFYRVVDVLTQAGFSIALEQGISDEGDPWCVFFRPENEEVVAHFARVNGEFIADGAMLGRAVRGRDLRAIVDQVIDKQGVYLPRSSGSVKLYLHPAMLLVAFVASALVQGIEHAEAASPPSSGAKDLLDVGVLGRQDRSHDLASKKDDLVSKVSGLSVNKVMSGQVQQPVDQASSLTSQGLVASVFFAMMLTEQSIKSQPEAGHSNDAYVEASAKTSAIDINGNAISTLAKTVGPSDGASLNFAKYVLDRKIDLPIFTNHGVDFDALEGVLGPIILKVIAIQESVIDTSTVNGTQAELKNVLVHANATAHHNVVFQSKDNNQVSERAEDAQEALDTALKSTGNDSGSARGEREARDTLLDHIDETKQTTEKNAVKKLVDSPSQAVDDIEEAVADSSKSLSDTSELIAIEQPYSQELLLDAIELIEGVGGDYSGPTLDSVTGGSIDQTDLTSPIDTSVSVKQVFDIVLDGPSLGLFSEMMQFISNPTVGSNALSASSVTTLTDIHATLDHSGNNPLKFVIFSSAHIDAEWFVLTGSYVFVASEFLAVDSEGLFSNSLSLTSDTGENLELLGVTAIDPANASVELV